MARRVDKSQLVEELLGSAHVFVSPVSGVMEQRLLDEVACDGGYILAASHTIPPETPDENIFALLDEAGVSKEEIYDRAAALRQRGL